ncbi:hypothetical protein V496_05705 [Pseudogymnoascus sp. VKM F-4515 (FW-2607)]|nr:hypothetical protein V496_05705 [Pseudogymnoascus sp. VKM F-4515 (FW-2607)]
MAVAIVAEGSEGNPYGHYPSRGITVTFEPEVAFGDRTAGYTMRSYYSGLPEAATKASAKKNNSDTTILHKYIVMSSN